MFNAISSHASNNELVINEDSEKTSIDAVYFGQTHVQKPEDEYFTLVSNRKALIKVHLTSSVNSIQSPEVVAVVKLNGDKIKIPLSGPDILPTHFNDTPCDVKHSHDDSFTGMIPKEWVKPGMSVKIKAGKLRKFINYIEVGAPTVLKINMFDMYSFQDNDKDFPDGWKEEFEAKLPVSDMIVERQKVFFDEIVLIPRNGQPAKRVYSTNETSRGEQTAARWMNALMDAAGTARRNHFYYANVHGLKMKNARGGGFSALGIGAGEGYLLHEMGHGLSLAHSSQGFWPYKGTMCGIESEKNHVGSTWFFNLDHEKFVSPISERTGSFKTSPMLGGGLGKEKETWALTNLKHYSDYEVNKMQKYLQKHMVVWNSELKSYASWNNVEKAYTNFVNNNGVLYPIERDVDVISILTSVSAVTSDANIIYPPIGSYKAGLISLFDPRFGYDRTLAEENFCPKEGCDVSLKVIQGGEKKFIMLPISWDDNADPLHKGSLNTKAINLRASDGEVTKVQLLYTPDAEHNGLPKKQKVITKWRK